MAFFGRVLRSAAVAAACCSISSSKTLNNSTTSPLRLFHRSFLAHHFNSINASQIQRPMLDTNPGQLFSLLPAFLAVFFAVETLQIAYASSNNEADSKPLLPSEIPPTYAQLWDIAKIDRMRIKDLLRTKGLKYGSYPQFTVAVTGQKVRIKFPIPPGCEVPQLILNLASNLGMKADEPGGGSDMLLHAASDSAMPWQLTLNHPASQKESGGDQGKSTKINTPEGDLCVRLFRSLTTSDKAEIEFIKSGSLSTLELDALVSVLQLAGRNLKTLERKPGEGNAQMPSTEKSVASLKSMGVRVYGLDEPNLNSSTNEISWDNIAGYDQQKREIEDAILLPLQSPEVYDEIARGTRRQFESNRPRAVLFEGSPGTGKTSCARVIANQACVPLLYVSLEIVMSKHYGESERLLGKVFSLANELPNGAIIFLDEVDSFAVARHSEMHEATRRILSVLLQQIDGFEQDKKMAVIAATNRKEDLDPALISRFESIIYFGLPDYHTRQEIAAQYAKHLTKSDLEEFALATEDMSGRDIRGVCHQAERSWASKIIRGEGTSKGGELGSLPPLPEYTLSAMHRQKALPSVAYQRVQGSNSQTQRPR